MAYSILQSTTHITNTFSNVFSIEDMEKSTSIIWSRVYLARMRVYTNTQI